MKGRNGKSRPEDEAAEELVRGLSVPLASGSGASAEAGDAGGGFGALDSEAGALDASEGMDLESLEAGALDAEAGALDASEGMDLEILEAGALDSEAEVLDLSPAEPSEGPAEAETPAEEPPPPSQRAAILEALLFASAVPVRAVDLQEACGWPLGMLNRDLDRLSLELAGRGLELQKVAGAWRLVTAAETAPWVERFLKVQSRKQLSRAQLETLAVVAYRQPVTRAEVDAYRGVRSERTLHQLSDLRLVREVGRAEMPGRPIQYGTTSDFLRYFSLDRLEDLPVVERGGVHFRRHRGPFREPHAARNAAEGAASPGEAASEGRAPAVEGNPEEPAEPVEGEPDADAPSEEAGRPSQGLRKLLDRIRRRSDRESREQPAVGREPAPSSPRCEPVEPAEASQPGPEEREEE